MRPNRRDIDAKDFSTVNNDISALLRILRDYRTLAIVGLSADWNRPSFFVAKYLQGFGYRIIPVNPRYAATNTPILGETCYATLAEIPVPVDMVDVFRKVEDVLPIAKEAISIGAKCLWQQLGVSNLEADALAHAAGLDSVYNRCVKIEHARLRGGLNWAGINTGVISARRQG
jgi:predicted CoA-binding protein